jgi:hypothetical protein
VPQFAGGYHGDYDYGLINDIQPRLAIILSYNLLKLQRILVLLSSCPETFEKRPLLPNLPPSPKAMAGQTASGSNSNPRNTQGIPDGPNSDREGYNSRLS